MQKILVLIAALILPLMVIKAQDKTIQPPIIAIFSDKLYAVSAEDGSATPLVILPPDQHFDYALKRFGRISPDGMQMVYASATDPESIGGLVVSVYLLDLRTGSTEYFQPVGGVFSRKPLEGYHFRLDYPTWSVDGSRLYYLRSAVDNVGYGKIAEIQLAYYDVATRKHKLVARLNPKQSVQDLMAVERGIIVHYLTALGADQPVTLYALDGRELNKNTIGNLYPNPVQYEGHDYYATGQENGEIATLVNVETGEQQSLKQGYLPAERSRLAGEKSMQVFRFIDSRGKWFDVYGADYHDYLGEIAERSGAQYTFAPDGQSLAFIQPDYSRSWSAPIRIMDADGKVRELPFEATAIWWSAAESVTFYWPG